MLVVEELLQPIDGVELCGQDLRYEPLVDNIREARSEDDDSLPMGDWARTVKRADYPRVVSLTTEALRTRSKDLWLAVWLGEALIYLDGYDALAPVLRFLLELQRQFWPNVYPQIEDGDVSLRAAPLQWALDRYATLLYELPVTKNGISYTAYKAARSGAAGKLSGEALSVEELDSAVDAGDTKFYAEIEAKLAHASTALEDLYLFCDERYRDDGPSFVRLRTALDEVHNVAAQLLRMKRQQAPDPPAAVEIVPEFHVHPEPGSEPVINAQPTPAVQHDVVDTNVPVSRDHAMRQVERCADYLLEQQPENPAGYLLALAFQCGEYDSPGETECFPASETRLALKRASESQDWSILLKHAIRAMMHVSGRYWLDLYRYVWQAAAGTGAAQLQAMALAHTRALSEENPAIATTVFDDGTPLANEETKRWLEKEVNPPVECVSLVEKPVVLSPSEPAAPITGVDYTYTQALQLAEAGDLLQAARVLVEDPSAQSGRASFMRRLAVCRLCMQAGHTMPAIHMLRRLLSEIDERRLEDWEDRATVGEVLSMLLQALGSEGAEEERRTIYARLCQFSPVMALDMESLV